MSFKRLSKSSSAFPPPLELGKKNSAIHADPHSTLQPRSSELHEGVTKVLYIFSKLLLAICLWAELVTSTWSPKWKRKNKTDHASSRLYISQTNWFWTPLWISPMSQVQNGQNSREFRLSWLFHTCTTNGHLRCGIKTWCTLCQIFVCDKRCPTLFTRFRSMFSCFCVFCLQKLSSRFFPTPVFSALASLGRSSASGVSGQLHTVASCQAPGDPSHWTTASDNSWQNGTKNRPTLLQRVASPASHQSINHQSHPSFAARITSSLIKKMGRKMHCHNLSHTLGAVANSCNIQRASDLDGSTFDLNVFEASSDRWGFFKVPT